MMSKKTQAKKPQHELIVRKMARAVDLDENKYMEEYFQFFKACPQEEAALAFIQFRMVLELDERSQVEPEKFFFRKQR